MWVAYSRWSLGVIVLFVLLNMALWVGGLFAIYIADEYVTPAFSEQSVPQPHL
jgi:hypothetical protein